MFFRLARRAAFAVALFATSFSASAQTYPTVPSGTVIGRTAVGTGPAQAIPFSTLIALMLQSSLTIPTINTNSVIYRGSTSGQATVSAQAVAGTPSIKWPTTSGTVPTSATSPILLDAVTGAISCPTCATSTSAASPIVASRALAQTLNLSSFTGLVTVGYAASGDGGGATFKKITSGNFVDSFVATGSVSAAGTCSTNGTFYGVSPTGGTGGKLQGIVVIAGGVMTSFTPTGSKGNAYTAGNALTIPNGSYNGSTLTCSVSPQWTVATVTTPSASFTDSVGTKFQYIVDNGNFPNVRQFGAKLDRAGKANDGLATNDQAAVQNALNFTGYGVSNVDTGGYAGGKVIVPAGTALICNGLMVPFSIKLSGVSNSGTTLKQCDADASTQQFITLGDPQNHQTAHFVGIERMTLFGANAAISGTVAMVYSNSTNSDDAIVDVSIYPIYRACVYTETGYGGASIFHIRQMYCVPNSSVTPFGVSLNGAANNVIDGGTWFSAGGPVWGGQAILQNTNGPAVVNRFVDVHCENVTVCAYINTPAGGNGLMTYISGMVGNATVVDLIQRVTGSAANQLKVELIGGNGSNCTVRNAGTCVATGNIIDVTKY